MDGVSLYRVAALMIAGGIVAVAVAFGAQYNVPQPTAAVSGSLGPVALASPGLASRPVGLDHKSVGLILERSKPVSIRIPAIGVSSPLQALGLNPDGTIAVPQPGPKYNEAAWFKDSPTPGELGPSVIEGHIDSASEGPSVFFKLGALKPGDQIDVALADGTTSVFTVTGVRQYSKTGFPTATVYGNTNFAALRLITCGGTFDHTSHHYLSNTVVFAELTSAHPTQ